MLQEEVVVWLRHSTCFWLLSTPTHMHTYTSTRSQAKAAIYWRIERERACRKALSSWLLHCMHATRTYTTAAVNTNLDTLVFLPLRMSPTALMHFHFARAKRNTKFPCCNIDPLPLSRRCCVQLLLLSMPIVVVALYLLLHQIVLRPCCCSS